MIHFHPFPQDRTHVSFPGLIFRSLPLLAVLTAGVMVNAEDYKLGPDSQVQDGVPQGTVEQRHHVSEQIYPGAERDYWVYVPAQYDAEKPTCLMVFQDGGNYQRRNGQFRTTTVFDNLIHKGEMPVTIGVFVNPGTIPASRPAARPAPRRSS